MRHPERCIRRRWIVLSQMKKNGVLSTAQFDSLKVRPLDMSRFKKVNFTDDRAPYACSELKQDIKALLNLQNAPNPTAPNTICTRMV